MEFMGVHPNSEQIVFRSEFFNFIVESNKIEEIHRAPTQAECWELQRFMKLPKITVEELIAFVAVYQPNAKLRDVEGRDVRVGSYYPPLGGPKIRTELEKILDNKTNDDAFILHVKYEQLHPFTDGNGRSGRALWAWKQQDLSLGFLRHFYYQTLQHAGKLTK
jgi:hypothetical protein